MSRSGFCQHGQSDHVSFSQIASVIAILNQLVNGALAVPQLLYGLLEVKLIGDAIERIFDRGVKGAVLPAIK